MPVCTNCGAQTQSSDRFCGSCGRPVASAPAPSFAPQPAPQPPAAPAPVEDVPVLPYLLSPQRVLVMTVLSYGLYLFYWFYLTWRQYRDHTSSQVFPVWHALTLLLPIYGLFRARAHVSAYRRLMTQANLPCSLSPGWAVALVMVYSALGWASFQVSGGFQSLTAEQPITQGMLRNAAIIDAGGILVVAGLLLSVPGNLNRYWASLPRKRAAVPPVAPGEVAFALLGLLFWIGTLAGLVGLGP